MNNNKPTVSICIPAYNEAANISFLLEALLAQKSSCFKLDEIIVVSDGSTDVTVNLVKNIKDKRIRLISGKKRLGQNARQNQMLRHLYSDVLVILEADTIPADTNFLDHLVRPLCLDKSIGIAHGHASPLAPKGYFESLMITSYNIKNRIFKRHQDKSIIYLCRGQSGRAFSKDFAKSLLWPQDVSEDAFAYLFCLQSSFRTHYAPNAINHYRSVNSIRDYLLQSGKYVKAKKNLYKYFPKKSIIEAYHINSSDLAWSMHLSLLRSPLKTLVYLALLSISRLLNSQGEFKKDWKIYTSSKRLISGENVKLYKD